MIDLEQIRGNIDRGQLSQADALALVSEVERLRAFNGDLRLMVDGLETAAHEERAAVVAWLRRGADEMACYAGCIERGEHRRKGEP